MTSLTYFLIALGILIIFAIMDGISHQKFSKKGSLIFHLIAVPILIVSILILVISEFKFTFLVFPGILFIVIGLYISYKGFVEIKPNILKAGEVYRKGIYSKIRHPIYSGLILSLIGLSLFVYSIIFIIYAVVAVIMLLWLISYEEKNLIRRFGKKYISYREKVPMLLPFKINRKRKK